MKALVGIIVLIIGLIIGGYGMKKEGKENLKVKDSMEVEDTKDPVNLMMIAGIVIAIGGTVIIFMPAKK